MFMIKCRLYWFVTAIGCLPACHLLEADDVVVYSTSSNANKRSRATGEILDFTGEELTIRQVGGRENSIPTSRVIEVQSEWTPQQKKAEQLFHKHKFTEALAEYQEAARVEHRLWAKRGIFAQIDWCNRALGNLGQAATAWLSIYASDPTTQYFEAIPLAWQTVRPDVKSQEQASEWLSGNARDVERLIGASWLISSGQRNTAIAALRRLSSSSDPRIAHLADAQLWRTQIVTAKRDDVTKWQQQIDRMPEALRAGPYFVLGQVRSRLEQREPAALAFMRVPVFHQKDYQLVAASLHSAARELEQLGRSTEALGLYNEVASDYADAPIAAESAGRLKALSQGAKDD